MMMSNEIERKFLIKGDFMPFVVAKKVIKQGYLSTVSERVVRVRLQDEKGFLTIKGKNKGISRFEWEKEITAQDAQLLLELCEPFLIEKTRYIVPCDTHLKFEIDAFEGVNQGLVVAEIELPSEDFAFTKPDWLGEEVSDKPEYFNANLVKKPYTLW